MWNSIESLALNLRLVLAGAALFTFGCASPGSEIAPARTPLGDAVDAVAEELARTARQRIDLSSMRIHLREVTEIEADTVPPMPSWPRVIDDLDYLAEEIHGELLLALSSRFNLIDTDFDPEPLVGSSTDQPAGRPSLLAAHFGATHIVLGTIAPHGDEIRLKVRLVDVGNRVIVAVARGTVPVELLSDRSRVALGDLPPAYTAPTPPPPAADPIETPSLAAAPLLEEPESGRTELDRLISSRGTKATPYECYASATSAGTGPAAARFTLLGRGGE
jgi:hypothetical protein